MLFIYICEPLELCSLYKANGHHGDSGASRKVRRFRCVTESAEFPVYHGKCGISGISRKVRNFRYMTESAEFPVYHESAEFPVYDGMFGISSI